MADFAGEFLEAGFVEEGVGEGGGEAFAAGEGGGGSVVGGWNGRHFRRLSVLVEWVASSVVWSRWIMVLRLVTDMKLEAGGMVTPPCRYVSGGFFRKSPRYFQTMN